MQTILYFLSFVFLIDSVILIYRKSFTLGLAIMIVIGLGLFVLARWLDFWLGITSHGTGIAVRAVFLLGVFFYLFMISFVLSFGRTTVTYDENAVIVLGCGLNEDGTPGPTLTKRLEGCVEYYRQNNNCYVVVSGGYSRYNNVTEGSAMKNYLVNKGIAADKILVDENATNTRENFIHAMNLLKSDNIPTDNICYITNDFHIYRAGVYAKQIGFTDIKSVSTATDYAVFIPAVLREVIGVIMMIVFNY